ncbi:MAG: TVP38/TMEM64 family protein [Candidatus Omnitrophica bacterium]|nr:TVP38/TMEM64 family protein [Candidatus Omnitrophota bacterium]
MPSQKIKNTSDEDFFGKDNFAWKLAGLVLFIGIVFITSRFFQRNSAVTAVLDRISHAGLWAPVLYSLCYVLISGVLVPAVVLNVFAGTLFGLAWGVVIVTFASTISMSVKFLLARYLFRESVIKKIEKNERLKAVDNIIEKDGWKMLIILRNVPVVSSMLLNYICGITKMRFKDYVLASFIGRLPTTFVCVYFGYILKYAYLQKAPADYPALSKLLLFIGLLAMGWASFYMAHLSRKVLAQRRVVLK